jgi:hypothetical protein
VAIVAEESSKGFPYLTFTDLNAVRERCRPAAMARLPYVHDTWKNRTDEERLGNIFIGLVAQVVLEQVFTRVGLESVNYDETRIDDFKNDDPFDFLLLPPNFADRSGLIEWLQEEIYPNVNSQGRLRNPLKLVFRDHLQDAGIKIADLKSSVDNNGHGIEKIIHEQHHIAYAEQKNDAGFLQLTGSEYLNRRRETYEDYVARKHGIKDVHFRVFFSDASLATAYYVGFTFGRELVETGEVSPMPGRPWVLYHKQIVADCYAPGTERETIFGA